jgi:hypothetical protein
MARLSFWHCQLQGRATESRRQRAGAADEGPKETLRAEERLLRHRLNWRGCLPQGQRGSPENIFCF